MTEQTKEYVKRTLHKQETQDPIQKSEETVAPNPISQLLKHYGVEEQLTKAQEPLPKNPIGRLLKQYEPYIGKRTP